MQKIIANEKNDKFWPIAQLITPVTPLAPMYKMFV